MKIVLAARTKPAPNTERVLKEYGCRNFVIEMQGAAVLVKTSLPTKRALTLHDTRTESDWHDVLDALRQDGFDVKTASKISVISPNLLMRFI